MNKKCNWPGKMIEPIQFYPIGIVETQFDADKLKEGENPAEMVDIDKADPIVYFNRLKQYRKTGEWLDKAYETGRSLF